MFQHPATDDSDVFMLNLYEDKDQETEKNFQTLSKSKSTLRKEMLMVYPDKMYSLMSLSTK